MTSSLHVLVYGSFDAGACDEIRFGMHVAALAERGVELRSLESMSVSVPAALAGSKDAAFASEDAVVDRAQLDWADVIVFKRFYVTQWSCRDCALVGASGADLVRHRLGTGHRTNEPDRLIRPLFTAFEQHPELLRGRGLVYESDDDLLNVQDWNGMWRRIAPERDIIERMIRRADLVTVATPVLAERHRPFNDEVRVIRNAIDPAWYELDAPVTAVQGDPRLLYYGSAVRMRDYAVCRPAVDDLVAMHPGARRVWLGALGARVGGAPEPVIAAVDELGPYVDGARAFARSLAAARPDIGLAPLVGDAFDRAKSELHWLEYTMAGAATVATSIPGGGPFDPIRHGVDGLLAADAREWRDALGRLAGSRSLREEMVGRARERILAEYTVQVRAGEWAEAYRWAAEHAGRAVGGRVHGLGEIPAGALAAEGRASLGHRRRLRGLESGGEARLAAARAGRSVAWTPSDGVDPLVSVIVPVVDEPPGLVRRAIASVLAGTHPRLEVILAATEGRDPLGSARRDDPRVRLVSVDLPASDPAVAMDAGRSAATGRLLRAAIGAAEGAWIAPLGPEAEFEPDHIEILLGIALEHELEFVYGQAAVEVEGGGQLILGAWPPAAHDVLTIGTELLARRLTEVTEVDPEAWRDAETPGWAMWRSLIQAGVRMAGIDHVVTRLYVPGEVADLVGALVPAGPRKAGAVAGDSSTVPQRSSRPADRGARTRAAGRRGERSRREARQRGRR